MAEAGRRLSRGRILSRSAWTAGIVLLGLSGHGAAAPDPATPVLGRWLTHGRDGLFQIEHCGTTLCGHLVGMRYTGSMPLDWLRRPQCNLLLLTGFTGGSTSGRWNGTILDPDSGRSYRATIWSPDPETLKLRGYVLLPILGETQSWSRYHGIVGPACTLKE